MCEPCRTKAENVAELARYFRDKAAETAIDYYAAAMAETAEALEQLSRHFAEHCCCNEDEDALAHVFPPFTAHYLGETPADLYWCARREIRRDPHTKRTGAMAEILLPA